MCSLRGKESDVKRRTWFWGLCLLAMSVAMPAWARAPLMVSVDNPSFRKLVAATPEFYVHPTNSNPEARNFAKIGSQELARLLTFSQLFNVMNEAGYREAQGAMDQGFREKDTVDQAPWKALGIESLTVAKVENDGNALTVEIRTFDITRGEMLLAKRYSKVAKADYVRLIRRYANQLMEIYTGKPGIFSSKIAFVGRRSKNASKQIFICDFDGSNVIQITNSNVPHLSPHWSPDGRFLTFTSFRDGNPDLFSYELATGKRVKLSGSRGLNSGGQWAPNGKVIAFTGSVAGDADIYTVLPEGGQRKVLIKGSGLDVDPTFSNNMKYMAYVSGRFGNPHIFIATLEWSGDTGLRVTGDKRLTYAGWYNATPDFSPDSDKIAFAGYDKDIDRFDVFMMNPDGTQMERLTLKRGYNESPSWAPNGQLLAFHSTRVGESDRKGVAQLYVMNRDGSNQIKLPTGLYEAQTPDWSGPLYASEK